MTQPTDYSSFQVGGVVEPIPVSTGHSLLRDADPALFFALDFWAYCIRKYVGDRLMQAVTAAGMIEGKRSDPIRSAVQQIYPWAPDLEFTSNQFNFPLLAAYRKTSTYKRKTASWENDRCSFDLFYAFPPLTAGQNEAVLPILRAVEDVVRKKTTQGWDPGYTPPGGNLGDQPWGLKFASVEEVGFERGHQGTLPGTGSLKFPFLLMEGYFIERDMYLPAANKFAGGDITGNLVAPDQTTVPTLLQVATQQAPTVLSVSPNAGTIAGGTPVTITGTLFMQAPMVLFGNTPATNVTWVSATSITCTTPAVSGSGTLGVTVVNRDGQAGSLASAYTYS